MTIEDQKKCAEIFHMITGEETNPEDWNDSAGALLSEMVAKLRECSGAMDFVPRPTGFKPGLGCLVKQAYGAFKHHFINDKRSVYSVCLVATGPIKRQIEIALATGE